jgi:hypothetical protein
MEGLPILAGSILRLPLWSYSKDQKKNLKEYFSFLESFFFVQFSKRIIWMLISDSVITAQQQQQRHMLNLIRVRACL